MTSWMRSRASSLVSRCATWVFAVAGLIVRWSAISALDMPRATSSSTSRSRSVSTSMARACAVGALAVTAGLPGRPLLANSPIRRRVTLGASSASPPATTRMALIRSAGSVSLSRNPLAPARSAAYTYSSRSNVVRISTRTSVLAVICRVASMPSMTGIRTSIRTTSGLVSLAAVTAALPFAASPTISRPGVAAMMPQKPTRTRAWSSATTTRSVMPDRPATGSALPPRNHTPAAVRR